MTQSRVVIGIAVCGLCAALALVGVQAASGAGRGAPAKRLILSPRAGRTLPARPLTIRIRTGSRPRRLRVRLNGEAIGKYFAAPNARGVRRLSASASYGLRHGRNRLVVDLRGAKGRLRSRTVRFRVRRNRPLAGAGFNRRVAVGARVYLNGRRSQTHTVGSGFGAGPSAPLRHRWRVVRAPGGEPPGAGLRASRSARPHFVAREPGKYVVRVRVRARDGKVGSDLVDVRADPVPAAAIDTMAQSPSQPNTTGIQVGSDFYPAQAGAWLQLVTLDRATLEPVTGKVSDLANKSYQCAHAAAGDPGLAQCISAVQADLKSLDGHDLVIASNPISTGATKGTPGFGLESALGPIGVAETSFTKSPAGLLPGSISAIGVPGTKAGKGDWHAVAAPKMEGEGRMRDYLIRNNEGDYVFSPSDRIEFNTQAPGSNPDTNVVQIGEKTFSQPLSSSVSRPARSNGGFQVVVVDRQTLAGKSYWFRTAPGRPLAQPETVLMWQTLAQANSAGDKLVIVASRGQPFVSGLYEGATQGPINRELQHIADQIERLGGTRNAIFHALDPGLSHHDSYTLVGASNLGAGNGQEALRPDTPDSGSPTVPALSVAPMSGTLARTGPNYGFEVQTTPTVGPPGGGAGSDPSVAAAELNKVTVQPPSAWPEQGNAGRRAAIAYIGRQVFGTSDPRAQYWTVIYKPSTWEDYSNRIGKLTYSPDGSFTAADLEWAKAELQQEIRWLENTHDYLTDLSEPFSKTELVSWAAFEQISNRIREKVGVGVDQKTRATEAALWSGFRQLLGAIPEAGHAFHAADAVYETVMSLVEINHEPAEDDFQSKASELGVQLAERMNAAQDMLTHQIPNTIAADYAKLRTVGSCASRDPSDWPACPFDHADWQYTQDDQAKAARVLLPGMQTWAYGSLLAREPSAPPNAGGYNLYQLPPWWRTKVGGPDSQFYGQTIDANWYPFDGEPDSAQYAKPIYRNLPRYGHTITRANGPYQSSGETWQIYALGNLTGDGTITNRWLMHHPPADVTDPIFKPVSKGGLGADPESFFDRYFPHPVTLDHYPEKDTPTGWCAIGLKDFTLPGCN